jgi:hypothetical protein
MVSHVSAICSLLILDGEHFVLKEDLLAFQAGRARRHTKIANSKTSDRRRALSKEKLQLL